jgi:pimeloyl-ACP methyl ester carboxylesterase
MFSAFYENPFALGTASAPELEVIERQAAAPVLQTPVLFVHGAYAGAWCWDEYFLDYFAERGISARAVSLRGHGRSKGKRWLHSAGVADYVEDVRRTVEGFERPPVLIGHSMGGMVVQKYLERYSAPAAVLMASVPPSGLALPTLQLMLGDPWLFVQISLAHSLSPQAVDFKMARRAIFSNDVPDTELERFIDKFQNESQRAIWDMTMGELPRRWRMQLPPLLVLGGEHDALFSPAAVRQTATAYGVPAHIFPNMAHAMMLERGWQGVADSIIGWLVQQVD